MPSSRSSDSASAFGNSPLVMGNWMSLADSLCGTGLKAPLSPLDRVSRVTAWCIAS